MSRRETLGRETWYEVQRLYNAAEGNPGEWLMWEQFLYDLDTELPSQRARKRLERRAAAKRSAKGSRFQGFQTRIIHCELIEESR